ncbi:MAG: hypothetical protein RLZZ571_1125 [Actinomycetota bacterium]|jgi:hypothetical protein
MSEKNESVAEVPAEGNSADFFSASKVKEAVKAKRVAWPWLAVAATAVVAGLGGFAIGHTGGFNDRPAAFSERLGNGPMGDHQMNGHKGGHHDGRMGGQMMGDNDGLLNGSTPHCHDANGQDVQVQADGTCADGSIPGEKMMGPNTQPSASPSASSSKS